MRGVPNAKIKKFKNAFGCDPPLLERGYMPLVVSTTLAKLAEHIVRLQRSGTNPKDVLRAKSKFWTTRRAAKECGFRVVGGLKQWIKNLEPMWP